MIAKTTDPSRQVVAGDPAEDEEQIPTKSTRVTAWLRSWLFLGLWCLAAVLSIWWLDGLGRGRTFFFDEWDFVVDRWRLGYDTFLAPHNGHLVIGPAFLYFLMFELVGLDHYRAFRLLGILAHVGVATVVMLYVRRRLGDVAGFLGGLTILLLGTGWQNVLWPFQISFMGSILFFVVALLVLEANTLRSDVVATGCVALALGFSGVGVVAAGAVLLEVLFTRPWRRWWIAMGPICAYGIWYVLYGSSEASGSNVDAVPSYVSDSGSAAVAGLYGLSLDWGRVGFGLLLGLAAATVLHRRGATPRVLALAAMLLGFWVLTAVSRGQVGDPGASRYVYLGAVVIVLLASELVPRRSPTRIAVVCVVLGLLSVWATSDEMRAGAGGLRLEGEIIGAELAIVEALRDAVRPDYQIDPVHAPGLVAAEYFESIDNVGSSPAADVSGIVRLSEFTRIGVDRVLFEVAPPVVSTGTSLPARCGTEDFEAAGPSLRIEPGSIVYASSATSGSTLSIGRWAPESYEVELLERQVTRIELPDDGLPAPWSILSSSPSTRICSP